MNMIKTRSGDIVYFDEVDAPFGVHPEQGIVVGLSAFFGRIHTIHIRIPRTDRIRVRDISCRSRSPHYWSSGMNGLPRNSAHNMNAEFERETVHIIGQRLEPLSACC